MTFKFLKAQCGDSFLISFKDNENTIRNILIDGGMDKAWEDVIVALDGDLKKEINRIRKCKEKIDLLILTHIDNDHICGLLKWFENDKQAYKLVQNVWFNSGKLIASELKKPENPDLNINLRGQSGVYTGVAEAIQFEDYLLQHKIWKQELIITNHVFEDFGIRIQVFSPDKTQLKKLLEKYHEKTKLPAYTGGKKKDWGTNLTDLIEEENSGKSKFSQDTSATNGSSISFLLTIAGKNFLFLGDCHPKGIVKVLKKKGYSKENPLEAEFLKLSHHGSKANTCRELLEIIKTNNYIISTDGTSHGHPNKRTLARVISVNPEAVFHFNHENVFKEVFTTQDKSDFKIQKRLTTELIYDDAFGN